jgi:hypothetical protein
VPKAAFVAKKSFQLFFPALDRSRDPSQVAPPVSSGIIEGNKKTSRSLWPRLVFLMAQEPGVLPVFSKPLMLIEN